MENVMNNKSLKTYGIRTDKSMKTVVRLEKASLKFVAVDRIQSLSEKYILVTGAFGRLMYWEYEESFEEISAKLMEN
jgi:hypothetical protein